MLEYNRGELVEYINLTARTLKSLLEMMISAQEKFELPYDVVINFDANQNLWWGSIYGRKELLKGQEEHG